MLFPNIPVIPYEGPQSKNPLAFKFYNPEQIVAGKKMKEHLPFAIAWWHNLCPGGTAMFGTLAILGDVGCSAGPALFGAVSTAVANAANTASADQIGLKSGMLVSIIFPLFIVIGVALITHLAKQEKN